MDRHLAAAMIKRALLDLRERNAWDHTMKMTTQESARQFFFGEDSTLQLWCNHLAVDVERVRYEARRVMRREPRIQ